MDSTPICRCRVLYLGSAVPRQSKDGLQGIQEPLRNLYPAEGAAGAKGIDSWLSVWSNGILLENVDENLKQITRFFPIESLHYCAAVRQVLITERGDLSSEPKFLPLDSPFARMPRAQHPPIFSAILRRTTGIKVLECHVFICKREAAANALVRCCFHAYADNSYFRQLEKSSSVYGTLKSTDGLNKSNEDLSNIGLCNIDDHQSDWLHARTEGCASLNSFDRSGNGNASNTARNGLSNTESEKLNSAVEGYTSIKNFYDSGSNLKLADQSKDYPSLNGNENHKVWNGSQEYLETYGFESPYEFLSGNTSTLGRPTRARQMSEPIEISPPPTKENKKTNMKKTTIPIVSGSLSGSLIRPINQNRFQKPVIYSNSAANAVFEPLKENQRNVSLNRRYHTIGHRKLMPLSSAPIYPIPLPRDLSLHTQHSPQLPLKLYPSCLMPQHAANFLPQCSTFKKKNNGIPVGMPVVPSPCTYRFPSLPQLRVKHSFPDGARPLVISSRKMSSSVGNGLDESGAESSSGTGIYKKKGHLNERAFSYSIRQEHRSRSHGSLASLQFYPPVQKAQDIEHMIANMGLKDNDDIALDKSTRKRNQEITLRENDFHFIDREHQAAVGNSRMNGIPSDFGK